MAEDVVAVAMGTAAPMVAKERSGRYGRLSRKRASAHLENHDRLETEARDDDQQLDEPRPASPPARALSAASAGDDASWAGAMTQGTSIEVNFSPAGT
ncbi:MAG: hypothetical protein DMF98_02310 [Acidobacteria bacterium]|nr:MAG: hypothetical protein DMF98_02310 [Acidobacteriota bacterium]